MGISIPYPFDMDISVPYPFITDVDLGNGFIQGQLEFVLIIEMISFYDISWLISSRQHMDLSPQLSEIARKVLL